MPTKNHACKYFIVALLIMAKTQKQLKCPGTDERTVEHPDNGVLFGNKKK